MMMITNGFFCVLCVLCAFASKVFFLKSQKSHTAKAPPPPTKKKLSLLLSFLFFLLLLFGNQKNTHLQKRGSVRV